MIRWMLEVDSWGFPIFLNRVSFENVAKEIVAPTEYYYAGPITGWIEDTRDRPDYNPDLRDRDLDWQYDDYDYRDQYDWRYEGSIGPYSWSYSDETLPLMERYI